MLDMADLGWSNLQEADLRKAHLGHAKLVGADLSNANLSEVSLPETDLEQAILVGTDFSRAIVADVKFVNVDLSETKGLDSVRHLGPSYIDVRTIYRSKGQIPEVFLQGIGVPDELVRYIAKIRTPECLYSLEQIDTWIKGIQKTLTIYVENINLLEQNRAMRGLDISLKIENELKGCQERKQELEKKLNELKQLKQVYY
jgi:hypothetical protein